MNRINFWNDFNTKYIYIYYRSGDRCRMNFKKMMITTNNKIAAESLNMFVFTFVCLNNEEKEKRDDYIAKKRYITRK
jgi:hypothetical protein